MLDAPLYDPLDYDNLTMNLVREMMGRTAGPLPPAKAFPGPGVYAIFYQGSFAPYASVRSPAATIPIYVGKAVPQGARKGGRGSTDGKELYRRLKEHAESVDEATNLDLKDFRCRYLTVVPLWVTMAERFLIDHYKPIWNVCVEGFGLHDPGEGRRKGEISWWDALHPGRSWAEKQKRTRTAADSRRRLADFLTTRKN